MTSITRPHLKPHLTSLKFSINIKSLFKHIHTSGYLDRQTDTDPRKQLKNHTPHSENTWKYNTAAGHFPKTK
jgi:hypothetical protein